MSSAIFEKMPVPKLFWYCVLPGSVSMLSASLYIVIDGMFVGHYMGSYSLAAISLMWPLLAVFFSFSDLITAGSAVQIGIYLGKKSKIRASRIFTSCTLLILFESIICGLGCYIFTDDFLIYIMNADEKTTAQGVSYTLSYCIFFPFVTLFHTSNAYLRLCGKQKFSMYLNVFVSILNLILDYIFIVYLRQGVWSASFTTCVSFAVGTLIGIYPFLRSQLDLRFCFGRFPLKLFFRMLFNGSSAFFTTNSWSILQLSVNSMLLSLGGSVAVGATAAVMYLNSVISMLLFGMSEALQPALSYCYGAKMLDRVWAIERKVLYTAASFSFIAFLASELLGDYVVPLYAQEHDIAFMSMMSLCLKLIAFSFLVNWIEICLDVFLTALDSPGRSFIASILRTLIFPLGFLYICAPIMGLNGVWLAPTFAGIGSAVVSIYLARSLWINRVRLFKVEI